jgi:hypothetical protein
MDPRAGFENVVKVLVAVERLPCAASAWMFGSA